MRVQLNSSWRIVGMSLGVALLLAAGLPATARTAEAPATAAVHWLPGVVSGDEAVAATEHRIQTSHGPLDYEARAGRLAIRSQETGEVRGYIFFVAYVAKSNNGKKRPITFAWNGGPTAASDFIHMDGMGPRRRTKDGMVDNPDTPLAESDLVFYDALETGFSRPAQPGFAPEFLNLQGDVAATAEFIRVYRTRFRALDQPLFICGESYGVFRAAAVADFLTERGDKIAGSILVSGDIPNIPQSIAFYDAMHIPARTATAFFFHRLPPELMKDRDATLQEVNKWATTVYRPALERVDQLSDAERDKIARELARYIGLQPDQVDRKTLVVHTERYLQIFPGPDGTQSLSEHDTRQMGELQFGSPVVTDHYLRDELGYNTDLTYNTLERGYTPTPGHPPRSTGQQFDYNQPGLSREDMVRTRKEGEVTYIARDNPPWMITAMRRDKAMRVFVSSGRYDPLNMCEGDVAVTATLTPDLSSRIENHCYEAGHISYLDAAARPRFLGDVSSFIRQTLASQADTAAKK